MKYVKIAALLAALTICPAMLTGCGENTSGGAESETTSSAATTASDVPAVSDDENTASAEENSSESGDDASDTVENTGEEAVSALQAAAEAAIDGQDWPSMAAVSNDEKDFISDFFLLDADNANYKELFIFQCPMSANLSEIIIIEADDISSAKADLEARQKKAREQDAFYPDDVERAGASIVGTEGSYAYFIMGNNASDVEKALEESLK